MAAFRYHGVLVVFLADDALKGYLLQLLILILLPLAICCARPTIPIRARNRLPRRALFSGFRIDLPLPIQLPPLGIRLPSVQELAAVAEPAEARLLVVLADVRGVVGHGDGADVGGAFLGADGFCGGDFGVGGVGVGGQEGGVGGEAAVGAVGGGL